MNIFTFDLGIKLLLTGSVMMMWTFLVGMELVKIERAQRICSTLAVAGVSCISLGLIIATWSFV